MFNVVLGGISLLLIGYYVVQNNDMAVQVWRARDAQTQLSELREERNELVANRASLDDRQQLTSLAVSAGMVPAGTVVYLVQDQPVAVR
jgi:cell division protein FtsB